MPVNRDSSAYHRNNRDSSVSCRDNSMNKLPGLLQPSNMKKQNNIIANLEIHSKPGKQNSVLHDKEM